VFGTGDDPSKSGDPRALSEEYGDEWISGVSFPVAEAEPLFFFFPAFALISPVEIFPDVGDGAMGGSLAASVSVGVVGEGRCRTNGHLL
jgi:hypothetical protein